MARHRGAFGVLPIFLHASPLVVSVLIVPKYCGIRLKTSFSYLRPLYLPVSYNSERYSAVHYSLNNDS